ncbi:glycosyl hydrolase family 18 protein [Lachnospiraceae bacterium 38-14]|uniref:glycosyl hydrolase family 18 protein n=1 Tax=Roseburia sp. 1XD42-69 TaxID=2320088 RepID=UPI000EA06A44|nr:glycosyl hydrolase family 18 protein [Roseburia sp. 1XD42-69]RKJ65517.1 LysM peptidoglycan-binding domain-containing protein [Roseburia sp. 1XD42-69]
MEIYVVKPGDTVDLIGEMYQAQPQSIIYANQMTPPYPLAVGQALLIPGGEEPYEKIPVRINGYAYPYINSWVLEQTLPYLTELSVFSYGFTPEGELIPPVLSVDFMIEAAYRHGTLPILTLTPFGADGQFNNYLIHSVVQSPEAVDNLILNLKSVAEEKGYAGVDVDFEYILAEDRDAFTDFVAKIAQGLHEIGRQVSVALAPKQSAGQKGLLYEGKDYGGLGAAADYVLLMTYEWGYTYGPPMAVAPIFQVRKVLDYAVTEIPTDKIRLGIPNYGYDWKLPFERGVTKARTIGNVEAVQIAIEKNAEIFFDERAMSPYFHYWENGEEHEVWFEDVRSMQAKFELIKEYGLNGAGYWQIMRLFRANWLLLDWQFDIIK